MTAPRTFAYRALRQVLEAGQMTDEALNESRLAALPTRDRGFVRTLLMAALRDYGRIKKLLWPWLKSPEAMPPEVWAMLVLGAAQLLVLKTPPHAAVNETLELAVREGMGGFKGLLNAILRRIDREGHAAFDKIPLTENYPLWLRNSWKDFQGSEKWYEILSAEPPLDITVPSDISEWAEKLGGEVITPQTVRIAKSGDVTKLPGFDDGAWWVQDVAAAMPVAMLGDIKDLDVLDLCAAPGGKTMQLLAGGANVTAVDSSAQRIISLNENLRRMKMTATVQAADVMRYEPAAQFDVVLLDAPCSATGTLRRHPEILLHRRAEDITRLAALQAQMLARGADWVKPGGRLLYAVCSLQPPEGEAQIEKFLAEHQNFTANGNHLRITPTQFAGGADGFFAAVLVKAA
jgi:16S rRNA (cytosine967-C5)-methyltransferase